MYIVTTTIIITINNMVDSTVPSWSKIYTILLTSVLYFNSLEAFKAGSEGGIH